MDLPALYAALGAKITAYKEYTEQRIQSWMQSHLSAQNPHNVTTELIGAAKSTTKVQGKPLSADVILTAADIEALPANATAKSAERLATPRLIRLNGLVRGEGAFDGAANIQIGVSTGVAPVRYEYPDEFTIRTFYDDPLYPTSVVTVFNADGQIVSSVCSEPQRDVSYAYHYDTDGRLTGITPSVIRDELPHYEIGTSPVLTQGVVTQLLNHLDPVAEPDPHTQYQLKS